MSQKSENSFWTSKRGVVLLFFCVVVLWLLAYPIARLLPKFEPPTDLNGLGDSFGAITSLFTGLAFAGLIVTLLMQREQLKMQREELQLTREEMKKQVEEMGRQAAAQEATEKLVEQQAELLEEQVRQGARQAFEDGFFRRLELWKEAQTAVKIKLKFDAFTNVVSLSATSGNYAPDPNVFLRDYKSKYRGIMDSVLGTYFTSLHYLMVYVECADESTLKKEWFNLLRSQLGNLDKLLIAANCRESYGAGMKKMVEQYDLLKGIHPELQKALEKTQASS